MVKKLSMNDSELIAFGRNLRKIRKSRNITQEKLALLANPDYSYVNEVEKVKIKLSLLSLLTLSEALICCSCNSWIPV